MERPDTVTTAIETIRESASVERVYGDPIERADRTVVPVDRITYGFGGGVGEGSSSTESGEDEGAASGAGGGNGVAAKPIGVLEITDENTRFVRVGHRTRLLGAVAFDAAVG